MRFECPKCECSFSFEVWMNGAYSFALTFKHSMLQLAGIIVCPKCHTRVEATEEEFWRWLKVD